MSAAKTVDKALKQNFVIHSSKMLQLFTKKNRKGFTLIELLVVIAIIGILATIVLVSLNTARVKARDARRESDIRQYALALEMYYDSQTSVQYPATAGWQAALVSGGYFTVAPLDPTNSGTYVYTYTASGTPPNDYCLTADLENTSGPAAFFATKNGTALSASGVDCTP